MPATLSTVKIHLNSVASTPKAKQMTLAIKDFYYGTPRKDFEYGHMALETIPDEIIKQHNLLKMCVNRKAFFEIQKGMPGLKQVGVIAHQGLSNRLELAEHKPCMNSPSLWKHTTLSISFTLVVDDLGAKHIETKLAQHLIDVLRNKYETSTDWAGKVILAWTLLGATTQTQDM